MVRVDPNGTGAVEVVEDVQVEGRRADLGHLVRVKG